MDAFAEGGAPVYRILIADDEELALLSIRMSFPFDKYGFTRVTALSDPVAAREALLNGRYDAAFLDIRMPGVGGLDIARALHEAGSATAVVIVSGYSDFEYAKRAIQLGAFDYCLKPVQPDEADALLHKLDDFLYARRVEEAEALIPAILAGKASLEDELSGPSAHTYALSLRGPDARGALRRFQIPCAYRILPRRDGDALIFLTSERPLEAQIERWIGPGRALALHASGTDAQIPWMIKTLLTAADAGKEGVTYLDGGAEEEGRDVFTALIRYVSEHFDEPMQLSALSKRFGYSYTYLCELFKRQTGMNYSSYLRQLRMARAEVLLREGVSVSEVSRRTGFQNSRYFASWFRALKGMPPSEYRLNQLKEVYQ